MQSSSRCREERPNVSRARHVLDRKGTIFNKRCFTTQKIQESDIRDKHERVTTNPSRVNGNSEKAVATSSEIRRKSGSRPECCAERLVLGEHVRGG